MPRISGQIDLAKSEAILDAAAQVLSERGLTAPMEAIAKAAGVSKQTVYNHFGGKTDLIRALLARRVASITAPLRSPDGDGRPEEALAAYARTIMSSVTAKSANLIRVTIQSAGETPELARAVFEAGVANSMAHLVAFLEQETRAGRMAVDDPPQAAEFFGGMVVGHRQTRALLGVHEPLSEAELDRTSKAAAARFMRAYAP